MRLLADENFPGAAVQALIHAGHDVVWVRTQAPGASDREVLARAMRDGRILLTFDKDFGEIARRTGSAAGYGVILFRMPTLPGRDAGTRLARVIAARPDWAGHFSVIEPDRVRMRRLETLP